MTTLVEGKATKGKNQQEIDAAVKAAEELITREEARLKLRAAMQPAEIEISVRDFKNIFTAEGTPAQRNTGHVMRMRDNRLHSRVRVEGENKAKLCIRPGGATLRFIIKEDAYIPLGISFKRNHDEAHPSVTLFSNDERLGTLNFGQVTIRPRERTLDVTDFFKDEEADDQYKFSLIIQEAKTGAIGIIDPIIEHEGEN